MTATYLEYTLPMPVVATPGSVINLATILGAAFGPSYGGSDFWIAYYGAAQLRAWDFSYWNVSTPSVAKWFVGGIDIGPGFNHERYLPVSQLATADFHAGNDIGRFAYVTVPSAGPPGNWTEYVEYSVITIAPSLMSATAGNGAPTPADIVAAAHRFAAAYVDVPNDNDCPFIAAAVAAAAGATLLDSTVSIDPTQNQEGGFWRIAYRGSDPNPVANWQSLVQPGDIVRMEFQDGITHTTTVLSRNPDGSLQVYDNDAFDQYGTEIIGIHTANYDQQTIASTITIYRLTPDHLYLINGTALNEDLHGTLFNDLIVGNGGADRMAGWVGDDVYTVDNPGDVVIENPNEGTDTVIASISYTLPANVENLVLAAGAGSINAVGNGLSNIITGNSGNNTIDPGAGDNTVDGAGGVDTLDYSSHPGVQVIDVFTGTAQNGLGGTDHFSNIAQFLLGPGDDFVYGGPGNHLFMGGGGNNTISYVHATNPVTIDLTLGQVQNGFGGVDHMGAFEYFYGGQADDTLLGGPGQVFLDGGGGWNIVDYTHAPGSCTFDMLHGMFLNGFGGQDHLGNFEVFKGSSNDDLFIGPPGSIFMDGGGGIDTIDYSQQPGACNVNLSTGLAQNGFGGTDHLSNFEIVRTGAQNDTLTGGANACTFYGGAGNNTFVFKDGFGTMTVGDFTASTGNVLDLTGVAAFNTFQDVQSHWAEVGNDVVITNPSGGSVDIQNTTFAYLNAHQYELIL